MLQGDRVDSSAIVAHRFRLERLLGQGGAGAVHAAFDLLYERPVALKILRSDRTDLEFEEGLRSEFRTLRALRHPGIVEVFDFGRADGAPFYTMELLEGRDLGSTSRGADPHAFVEHVARALDYLHANGLVHSDLKPSNVFRVGDCFKLTDFGLVRRVSGPRRETAFGTLAYMPPERLRAPESRADPREDIYAMGAVLFEMLAGRAPYVQDSPDATMAGILAGDLEAELMGIPEPWVRLLRRLLAPEPAARYATAWEFLQAWGATFDRTPAPAPAVPPPFVGRRRELAVMRAALADVQRGRGALVYVSGPPGIGKTAFLDQAAAQAAAAGLPTWRIDAPAARRPLALVEELATLYRRWAPGLPAPLAAAAARLADWPRAVTAAVGDEGVLNAHAHALADLGDLAREIPHVLVVDAAHRLDHASRALLRFMAANARDQGVLWLVGARTGAATAGDDSDDLVQGLEALRHGSGAVQTISLHELSADDVSALVRRLFGDGAAIDLVARRIHDLTRGHPFFVHEAAQHMALTGQLRRQTHGWEVAPQAERRLVPRMADAILSEHLTAVRDSDRTAYEVLALFPSGTRPAVLARVLEADEEGTRDALERGVRIGLLATDGELYRFAHDLVREACAARCPQPTAGRHHRAIAAAVAGTPAEAHHRLAAAESTPESRACFLREAQNYESQRAPWEALPLYEAALASEPGTDAAEELTLRVAELRAQVGQTDAAAQLLLQRLVAVRRPLLRARYLHRLGDTYGRQGRNAEALFHLQSAAELFQKHAAADEQRRFAADLVRILIANGDYPGAIAECTRVLADVPPEAAPTRGTFLNLQAQARRQSGDYVGAEATAREALETLKPVGRTLELAQAYTQLGTSYYYRKDFEQAERFYRAALKAHTELGDLHGMKSAYGNLAMALMRTDRLDEAIVANEKSLELKRRLGDHWGEATSLNNLGNLWERRGEYRRAFQYYRRAIAIYRRLRRSRELGTIYHNMAEVHVRLGRFHDALPLLGRAETLLAAFATSYIALMTLHTKSSALLALDETQTAIEGLVAGLQQVRKSGLSDVAARFHARLALAYTIMGDRSQSELHERQALELMPPDLEPETRLDCLIDLGERALIDARVDVAEAHSRDAVEISGRGTRSWFLACSLRLAARCNSRRGNWDRAEVQLESAISVARDLGFRYVAAKCYKELGHLHWDIGLRGRATDDFERCLRLLEALELRTELGLTYLELARLTVAPPAE
jgi:tetratricopeptide (TPR) repeat protein